MIFGVACLLLANLSSVAVSLQLSSRLRTGDTPSDVLSVLTIRIVFIALVIIAAGIGGFLSPSGVATLSVVAAVITMGLARTTPSIALIWKRSEWSWAAILVALFILIRAILQVWFLSPYNGDAVSYHLTKIAEWIRAGAFTRQMGVDTHASFPAGYELIETWWVVFLHHDVLIEMAGVELMLLACAGLYLLAKNTGLDSDWSLLAAASFALVPGIATQLVSGLNDMAIAAVGIATFALISSGAHLCLIVLAASLGIAIKPTFMGLLPGIALFWWFRRRQPRERHIPRPELIGFMVVAACLGSFFYVRNAIWFNNPFHPVGMHGHADASGQQVIRFGPSISPMLANISGLSESAIYDGTPFTSLLFNIAGWGPLAVALGAPAVVLLARQSDSFAKLALSFLASLLSVFALVRHDYWYLRFVLFFPAILCIGACWLVKDNIGLKVLFFACMGYQFLVTMLPGDIPPFLFPKFVEQPWRNRSYANIADGWHQEDAVAYCVEERINRGESYVLYKPDFSSRVMYPTSESASAFYREISDQNIYLVYWSVQSLHRPRVLEDCLKEGFVDHVEGRFLYFKRKSP